eukprot:8492709-Ditylum_brightwellii.AAC.1
MVSSGAGAPNVNPGDHTKQKSADAILVIGNRPPNKLTLLTKDNGVWDTGHKFKLDYNFETIFTLPTYNYLAHHLPDYTACVDPKVSAHLSALNNSMTAHRPVIFDSDSKMLIIDCGASDSFTYDKTNFIS